VRTLTGKSPCRVLTDMTISSIEVFPARSPIPFIVTSTCRAPPITPASVLAVARPRSLWQCVEKMALSAPGVFSFRYLIRSPYSPSAV